jgi:DNA-binding SARP family transcriptional activator
MAILQVSLFGGMKVTNNQEQSKPKLTRTSQLLLAYLLLERHRMHSRDVLAGLFWGEHNQVQARRCLNTALWRLRKAIDTDGTSQSNYFVVSHTGEVGFNIESEYWFDVGIFEECVKRIKMKSLEVVRPHEARELEIKIQLYVGELLEGIYTDWAIRFREYERQLHMDGLTYLMYYYKQQNDHWRSLEFCHKILDIEPLHEDIHREVMRLYLATGQRPLAIRQYKICCQKLEDELGISPMEETQALYANISGQSGKYQQDSESEGMQELQEVIAYIQEAARNLDLAQEQFLRVLQGLDITFPIEDQEVQ